MTKTIKELLAVLDMTEEEQLAFVNNLWQNRLIPSEYNLTPNIHGQLVMSFPNKCILADLAFRLRDEVVKECLFWEAGRMVWSHCYKGGIKIPDLWTEWWIRDSQPIHWIIAALIAKEL